MTNLNPSQFFYTILKEGSGDHGSTTTTHFVVSPFN